MPTFDYSARTTQGTIQTGHLDAIDADELVAQLQRRGLLVVSIARQELVVSDSSSGQAMSNGRRSARAPKLQTKRRLHNSIKTDDQVLLCQQLATLVEAGVPLLRSIEVVSAQVESKKLLLALDQVHRDVESGTTFRESLARHPKVFTKLWLNLVETGEASGNLATALRQLASHFEAAQHLENEAKTAMTYPLFLIGCAVAVVFLFVYWLIPKFTVIFATMDIELPAITKFVIFISDFSRKYVILIIGGMFGASFLLKKYLSTEGGQWVRDIVLLRIPVFNTMVMYIQLAEFSRGLSTLLDSGVPLLSSLEVLENSATNKVYGQAIGKIKKAVEEGKSMAAPMSETGVFPAMTVQMVQIGEEVGELAGMVNRVAKYYEERVEILISRMTRLFEPIAIVVMGVIVLFIVLSIFLPVFKLATGIKTG